MYLATPGLTELFNVKLKNEDKDEDEIVLAKSMFEKMVEETEKDA